MKAMIFAAGLGTRLMPLTRSKPKALVELKGKTLLEIVLHKLIRAGINSVIVNVHHQSEQIIEFLQLNKNFGMDLSVSDESGQLLDTGGGLKKASWFFDDGKPFLLHNVDVVSDIDLSDMLAFHVKSRALATVAVRSRNTSRYLLFDDDMRLGGWENVKSGEKIIVDAENPLQRYAFSGIHILDPAFLNMMTETGKFSIIETYLRLAGSAIIKGYLHDHTGWIDVGKPEDLKKAGTDSEGEAPS